MITSRERLPPSIGIDNEKNYVFCWYNWVTEQQLKAQKITLNGDKVWPQEGAIIYQGPVPTVNFPEMVASGDNKMIAIWGSGSSENYPSSRITCAMINADGTLFDNLVRISETIKDGNWNDPSIWADGKVPLPGADVIIKTNVLINEHVTCKSMKVVPPGAATVATGFIITITG